MSCCFQIASPPPISRAHLRLASDGTTWALIDVTRRLQRGASTLELKPVITLNLTIDAPVILDLPLVLILSVPLGLMLGLHPPGLDPDLAELGLDLAAARLPLPHPRQPLPQLRQLLLHRILLARRAHPQELVLVRLGAQAQR